MTVTDERLVGHDPLKAPPPKPRTFKNHVECIRNEVVTIREGYKDSPTGIPANVNPDDPYWVVEWKALDARRTTDNEFLTLRSSTKLFDVEGAPMDENQRPTQLAKAFAGLGIVGYPLTEGYDESRVVGRKFYLEAIPMKFPENSTYPIPIVAFDEDYIYTGAIRDVTPREAGEADSAAAVSGAVRPTVQDVGESEELLAKLVATVTGRKADDGDGILGALRENGLGGALQLDGKGLLSLAATDDLVPVLEARNLVAVEDGVVKAIT